MPKNLEKLLQMIASGSASSADLTSLPSGSRSARSRYVSSMMRHAPRNRARSHTPLSTSKSMVVPVGLDGDVTITALVRSLHARSTSSALRWKRVAALVGTSTTTPSKERISSRLHG